MKTFKVPILKALSRYHPCCYFQQLNDPRTVQRHELGLWRVIVVPSR